MPFSKFFAELAPEIRPGEYLLRAGFGFKDLYIVDAATHRRYVGPRQLLLSFLAVAGAIPIFVAPFLAGSAKLAVMLGPLPVIALLYILLALDAQALGRRGRRAAGGEIAPQHRPLPMPFPPLPGWIKRLPRLARYGMIAVLGLMPLLITLVLERLVALLR